MTEHLRICRNNPERDPTQEKQQWIKRDGSNECRFRVKVFPNNNLSRHEKGCKENPQRVKRERKEVSRAS
jgi:hypothetical protein